MFHFPGFAPSTQLNPNQLLTLIRASWVLGDAALPAPGCPIRISTDLGSLAPPRGFSQLATSFFATSCLGIHRMPFLS
jgi:hypothetical protein